VHNCKWDPIEPPTGRWPACDVNLGLATDEEGLGLTGYGIPQDLVMGVRWEAGWSYLLDPDTDIAVAAFRHASGVTDATADNDGGIALLHTYYTGTGWVTTLDPVPSLESSGDSRAGSTCADDQDTLFTDQPRLALDAGRSAYADRDNYELYLYATAAGNTADIDDDCKVWFVEDVMASGTRTTTWTSIPLEGTGDCPLTADHVQGVATAPWAAETVFVFGGRDSGGVGTGGVCALSEGTAATPEVVMSESLVVTGVAPHPHLSNVLLLGTKWGYSNPDFTDTPGTYVAELSFDGSPTPSWETSHVTGTVAGYTETLENPGVEAVAWAPYEDWTNEFYVATHGSGPMMGYLEW
jgi:hypothetical protein